MTSLAHPSVAHNPNTNPTISTISTVLGELDWLVAAGTLGAGVAPPPPVTAGGVTGAGVAVVPVPGSLRNMYLHVKRNKDYDLQRQQQRKQKKRPKTNLVSRRTHMNPFMPQLVPHELRIIQ